MADLKMQFLDATIDVNAGLGGLHRITVTCRGYAQTFQANELEDFMAILYPAIDAKAKELENYSPPANP